LSDVKKKNSCYRDDVTCEKVMELERQGFSIKESAEELGCCKSTITSRRKDFYNKRLLEEN